MTTATGWNLFPFGQTVTVIRPSPRDRYGDSTDDSSRDIPGCAIAWGTSTESTGSVAADRSETVQATVTVYMPPGTDITSRDHLILPDGSRWRVTGRPNRWHHPMTGWDPGVEVTATQSTTEPQGGL